MKQEATQLDENSLRFLLLLDAFLVNHTTVYRAFDLCPKEVLERIGRFTEKKPRPFMSYQEFLALHERKI